MKIVVPCNDSGMVRSSCTIESGSAGLKGLSATVTPEYRN